MRGYGGGGCIARMIFAQSRECDGVGIARWRSRHTRGYEAMGWCWAAQMNVTQLMCVGGAGDDTLTFNSIVPAWLWDGAIVVTYCYCK